MSLQARLLILVVAAILPLALLSVFSALRDMRRNTEAAQAELKMTASLVAANQDRLIDSTRDLLTAISVMPVSRQPDDGACQRYFENLKGRFPIYSNIGLLRADGQVRCHANARLGNASAADRPYFQKVVALRTFVMGEPIVGRLSARRGIPFALPVMDGDTLTGVVFASMDLTQAAADLARLHLRDGARVAVTDSRAVVLMEFPTRPGLPAERTLVNPQVRRAASDGASGVGEAADAEGVERVFAFAPSRDVAGEHLMATVSIDSRQVTAASLARLGEDLLALALSLVAGLVGATWLARRGIVRPARRILGAVRRLERGSLDERLPLPQTSRRDEFGHIAGAFNLMAESLQLRQRELDTELGRSHAAYSTLDLILNSLQEALVAVTPAGGLLMFNDAAARLFPLRGPDLLPQQWQAGWGIYRADGTTPYPTQELPMVKAARGESAVEEMLFVRNPLVPEGRLLHASYQPMQGEGGIVAGLVVFADITVMQHLLKEQTAQVQQMKDIQRRLMEAQRVGRTGSWELDLRTRRIWWSDEVYELFELERHDFDRSLEDFLRRVHPDDRPRLEAARAEAIERETPMDVEYRVVVADGGTVWLNERGEVRRDEGGELVAFSGVVQDITQRKRSEADLVLLRNAIARLNDIVIISEYDGGASGLDPRIVFANQAFERLLGFTPREAIGLTPSGLGLYGPRTDRQTLQRMREDLSRGEGTRGELVHYARDGRARWMEVVVVPMAATKGERAHLISVLRDVTARKEADEALKKNERELQEFTQMLQRTAEAAQAITTGQSIDGTMQAVVDQARSVIGAHQAVLSLTAGQDWSQVVTALSLSERYAAYRAMGTMPDGTGIYAVVCESNKPLRLTQAAMEAHPGWRGFGAHAAEHPKLRGLLAVPLVDRAGRNAGLMMLSDKFEGEFNERDEYVAVELAQLASIAIDNARLFEQVRDINAGLEARIAERTAELTRQEQLYRTLAEQAPEVIWNTDAQGRATFLNRAWYDLVGGTPGQWLGHGWLTRVHPDDVAEVQRNWARSRETLQPYSGVRRLRAGDGSYHTTSYKAAPVLDAQGQVAFWVGIDADITELKAIEHALRNSNQELQAFSYSVSHDLRAPLGAIAGFSQALVHRVSSSDERVQHYLARIQAGVGKMEELIEALLSLAQVARAPLSYATVDLSAMAREALEGMMGQEPQRQVAAHVEDGLVAQGDVRLLRVVMQNLLANAWKFTSKAQAPQIEVGRLGNSSVFFVRDNGVGFEMAYAHKLFGAFQRLHTEAEFPGTGIGLATVRRIVARHQGRVWAESQPGQGTAFFFTLSEAAPPAWLGEEV